MRQTETCATLYGPGPPFGPLGPGNLQQFYLQPLQALPAVILKGRTNNHALKVGLCCFILSFGYQG
jgi:hypothetical protein